MRLVLLFTFLFTISENCFCQNDSSSIIPPLPPKGKAKGKKIFDKVEREASFPGGDTAYKNFLLSHLQIITDSAIERKITKGVYIIDLTS